jgi:hypothetical protein
LMWFDVPERCVGRAHSNCKAVSLGWLSSEMRPNCGYTKSVYVFTGNWYMEG